MGLGTISDIFMRACAQSAQCKVTALVSGHGPQKAPKYQALYNIPQNSVYTYDTFDQIAHNPNIDAVSIGLPNSLHAEYTIRAAKAGKHVLCEKPSLYLADQLNFRIRKVYTSTPAVTPVFNPAAGTDTSVQSVAIQTSRQIPPSTTQQMELLLLPAPTPKPRPSPSHIPPPCKPSPWQLDSPRAPIASALYSIHLPVATSVIITPSSSSITTAQSLTVAVVFSANGQIAPIGSVVLSSGSYGATHTLANGATTFNLAAGTLPAAVLLANYTPDIVGASLYTPASPSISISVTAAFSSSTVTVSAVPSAFSITNLQPLSVAVSIGGAAG